MKVVRGLLAAAAVTAILVLGSVVALAAPGSVTSKASPSASAGRAVYCPKDEKDRRKSELSAFRKTMLAKRNAYFRTHPKAKDRTAFVKAQNTTLNQLVRSFAACD